MCAVKTHRLESMSQTDLAEFSFNCYRLTISFSTHAQGERERERVGETERNRERERDLSRSTGTLVHQRRLIT